MGLFDSLLDLATDTVKIVAAPVDAVVTVVGAGLKEVANVVTDLSNDVKDIVK